MRKYLPFLALSLVAVGCNPGPRYFTVTDTDRNFVSWPVYYGDGTMAMRLMGNLPRYQLQRVNMSSETLYGTATMPPYSSIGGISQDGTYVITRRLTDGLEYADVIESATGNVVTSERLSPYAEGEEPLEPPFLTADNKHLIFRTAVEGQPVTLYRTLTETSLHSFNGWLTIVNTGIGAYRDPSSGENRFWSIWEHTGVSAPFELPSEYTPIFGRSDWMYSTNAQNHLLFTYLGDGTMRTLALNPGDEFLGLGINGLALVYRRSRAMITKIDLASGQEADLSPWAPYGDQTIPTLSPDGTAVMAPDHEGVKKVISVGGTVAYSYLRKTEQVGFDAGGLNQTLYNSREVVSRNELFGGIGGSYVVPRGDKFEGLAQDFSAGFYRLGGYLYRFDPVKGQSTKLYAPWSVAEILFARDGKTAVEFYQNPRVGTQLRYRNAKGVGTAFTLPANTRPLGVMPDGRVMWHDVPEGKTYLRFTDPATGVMKRSFYLGQVGTVQTVASSADGTKLVAWANDARFADLTANKVRKLDDEIVRGVAISPDGSLVAIAHPDRVVVYKTSNYTVVWTETIPSDPNTPTKLAISPNNSRLMVSAAGETAVVNITGQ